MADSLRDQLLALGFTRSKPAEKPKEQRGEKPRGAPAHGKGKPPQGARRHGNGGAPKSAAEMDLAQAYALRARTEREAKEREQREAAERARQKKERKEKLAQLLADKALNAKDADVARNFPHGDKIRRVYVTNSLYSPWDAQFYPDGIRGWMAKVDVNPLGGIAFDERFLFDTPEGLRPHQVRLEGGDASSDSFCFA